MQPSQFSFFNSYMVEDCKVIHNTFFEIWSLVVLLNTQDKHPSALKSVSFPSPSVVLDVIASCLHNQAEWASTSSRITCKAAWHFFGVVQTTFVKSHQISLQSICEVS